MYFYVFSSINLYLNYDESQSATEREVNDIIIE